MICRPTGFPPAASKVVQCDTTSISMALRTLDKRGWLTIFLASPGSAAAILGRCAPQGTGHLHLQPAVEASAQSTGSGGY